MAGRRSSIKITYPNGKIYVGQDVTGTISYFGSPNRKLIAADFSAEESRDFTVRKQILWQSEVATDAEVDAKEIEFILDLKSNDPAIGYNRSLKPQSRFKKRTPDPMPDRPEPSPQKTETSYTRNGAANSRNGSVIAKNITSKTPWTATPTMRNGSRISHTNG